ncbi:MAG: sulfite exporter TauE/SafE family protein [Alphaproteobacteria bacterium]
MLAHGTTLAERFLAICSADALGGPNGGIVGALALAGLIGGALHCAPMCGPFVLAQSAQRGTARSGRFGRFVVSVALPYQLGRLTTYAALGALSGGVGGAVVALSGFRWLAAALLLVAAVLLIAQALKALGAPLPIPARMAVALNRFGAPLARRIGRANGKFSHAPPMLRGYALGVLLGFLPCGLLYGALFAAASSGSLLAGALIMAAFAAGTVPALSILAATGHAAARRWPLALQRISGVALALGAGLSAAFAVEWMG